MDTLEASLDRPADVRSMISLLGGSRIVAEKLGLTQSCVGNWCFRNIIAAGNKAQIQRLAKQRGIIVPPEWFSDPRKRKARCDKGVAKGPRI